MDPAAHTALIDRLSQGHRQIDRERLLIRLGVNPEDCLLNVTDPTAAAWRMVEYFANRGRLDDLSRAAHASILRRLVWRLTWSSALFALGILALLIAFDLWHIQRRLCLLPLHQPGLADFCGAHGLGQLPTAPERLAWAARSPGSCAALRQYLAQFPQGAYASPAQSLLAARRTQTHTTLVPATHALPLFVPTGPQDPSRAAAEQATRARALAQAQQDCQGFAASGHNRLRDTTLLDPTLTCLRYTNGFACSLTATARCALERSVSHVTEHCDPQIPR